MTAYGPEKARAALRRHYVKLCDLRDFDDPEFRARLHDIVPSVEPPADLHRKFWEFGMLTHFLEDVEALDRNTEVPEALRIQRSS